MSAQERIAHLVTLEDITAQFILDNSQLGEYEFGGKPGYTMFDKDNAEYRNHVWNKYKTMREGMITYLSNELRWASEAWDASSRYNETKLSYSDKPVGKPRDMWGSVQRAYGAGKGMRFVSCSGHGGMLLSHAREASLPEVFRKNCMYEEDCDINIIALFYPREFARCKAFTIANAKNATAEEVEDMWESVRRDVVRYEMKTVVQFTDTIIEVLDAVCEQAIKSVE